MLRQIERIRLRAGLLGLALLVFGAGALLAQGTAERIEGNRVVTGWLQLGTSAAPGITMGAGDLYLAGDLEVDGTVTFDGAPSFGSSGVTLANGETITNGTNSTITLGRNDAGTVTLNAKDNDATAALTISPGGAAALALGGASTTAITLQTDGGTVTVDGTLNGVAPAGITADPAAGTWALTKDAAGTAVLTSADDDATAALTVDPGGNAALTLGSASDTVTVAATAGLALSSAESISNGTQGAITLGRNDAGVVTVTCKDDDATAGCTYDAGGASPIVIGSADVTAVTVTVDGTGDAELALPENSIGADEVAVLVENVVFCGEAAENGAIFLGPAVGPFGGDGSDISIGTAGCDALDAVAEGDADAPLPGLGAFKVMGFWCKTDGTLGAAETMVFTLRSAAGNLTPSLTCTIAEAETSCRETDGSTTDVAAGATLAMSLVETSNNADDNAWCRVALGLK